ncbi:MAG: hypothetical protein AAGE18_15185 [Pseudomonadota bacterium]
MKDAVETRAPVRAGQPALELTTLAAGAIEGRLSAPGEVPPRLRLVVNGDDVGEAEVLADPGARGRYSVRATLPPTALTPGVQVIAFRTADDPAPLAEITLSVQGDGLLDLGAEVAALRAELEILRTAFRRHVAGTDLP